MVTMTQLDMTNRKIRLGPAAALQTAARDLVADWRRWTLPERIFAAVLVPLAALAALAMTTALASGGP